MQDAKERLTHVKGSLEPTAVKAADKKRCLSDDMKQSTKRGNKRRRVNANQEGGENDNVNISPNCLLTPNVQILPL